MDLGKYIRKSDTNFGNAFDKPKKCLECGKDVDRERAGHLYFQSFCSHACKERYVGHEIAE